VHNVFTRKYREAYIKPSTAWTGEGLLGCELALGQKYVIPVPKELKNVIYETKPKGITGLLRGWTSSSRRRDDKVNYENGGLELNSRKSMPQSNRQGSYITLSSIIS
jgi:hypothetical protein